MEHKLHLQAKSLFLRRCSKSRFDISCQTYFKIFSSFLIRQWTRYTGNSQLKHSLNDFAKDIENKTKKNKMFQYTHCHIKWFHFICIDTGMNFFVRMAMIFLTLLTCIITTIVHATENKFAVVSSSWSHFHQVIWLIKQISPMNLITLTSILNMIGYMCLQTVFFFTRITIYHRLQFERSGHHANKSQAIVQPLWWLHAHDMRYFESYISVNESLSIDWFFTLSIRKSLAI